MFDLTKGFEEKSVIYTPGKIRFPDYDRLLGDAESLATYLNGLDVDETNEKEIKKVLANANKVIAALDTKRKDIKKEMNIPYLDFETKVKNIINTVKESDEILRDKVKELTEIMRENKRLELLEIWTKRAPIYGFNFIRFEDWVRPEHLNKSVSLSKCEDNIVVFLEGVKSDLETIEGMDDSEEILIDYRLIRNLSGAIMAQSNRKREREIIKSAAPKEDNDFEVSKEDEFIFKVSGKMAAALVEKLLEENGVPYEKTKI